MSTATARFTSWPLALLLCAFSKAAPQADGRVLIEARDGSLIERRLAEFESRDLLDVGAAWVRFSNAQAPRAPRREDRADLELQTGDRLFGRIVEGDEDGLVMELEGGVRLPVSIDHIRSLVFASRLPAEGVSLLAPADEGDRLYRRTGDHLDRIDGAVERFSERGLSFESVLGMRSFDWTEVGALFVESFGSASKQPGESGQRVVCDLIGGSRLRGTLLGVDRRGCRLRIAGVEELLLPIAALSEISIDDGSIAFLSDKRPSAVDEGSPFGDDLGMSWPHRFDRSVMGAQLHSGGRSYARGIGVHAPSSLTFALDGEWDELRGLVAIDDQVLRLQTRGSVVFRIHVDGERAWESGVIRGGMPPVGIPPIHLTGAQELVLECDMSTEFAVADRANWLRLVLVKRAGAGVLGAPTQDDDLDRVEQDREIEDQ